MGCSASRSDGLEHEEALQHVIQMMRELKVKQIANIAARREGRRSREKYYGWAGVQGARAIAGGDAVLRKASISHANWRRGGPIDVVAPPGTLLDLPSDVTDTILDFLLEVSEKRDLSLGVQPRLDEHITPATVQRWRRESYSTSASVLDLVHSWGAISRISASFAAGPWEGYLDRRPALAASWHERLYGVKIEQRGVATIDALLKRADAGQIKRDVEGLLDVVRCFGGARHPAAQSITDALGDVSRPCGNRADAATGTSRYSHRSTRTSASGASASNASRCTRTATPRRPRGLSPRRLRSSDQFCRADSVPLWWRVPARVRRASPTRRSFSSTKAGALGQPRRGRPYCSTSAPAAWPTASILCRPTAGRASGCSSTSSPLGERARGPRPCGASSRCLSKHPVASSTRSSSGRETVNATQW